MSRYRYGRRKKKGRGGWILLLVLLLAGGGGAGWFYTRPPEEQRRLRERGLELWTRFREFTAPATAENAALAGIRPARPDITRGEAEAAAEVARASHAEIQGLEQVPGLDVRALRDAAGFRLAAGERRLAAADWPLAHAYFEASTEAAQKLLKTDKAALEAFNRRKAAQSLRALLEEKRHPRLSARRVEAAEQLMDEADLAFDSGNFPDAARAYMEAAMRFGELRNTSDQLFRYDEVKQDFVLELGKSNQELLNAYGGDLWREIQALQAQGSGIDLDAPGSSLEAYELALKRLPDAIRSARRARALEFYTRAMAEAEAAAASGDAGGAIDGARRALASEHDRLAPALRLLFDQLAKAGRPSGERVDIPVENGEVMGFCYVAPGSFRMGNPGGDPDELPAREVRIERPFLLGRTEVTIGQWRALQSFNPGTEGTAGHPAHNILWAEANQYGAKFSALRGLTFRLPAEAEWEYACRAGTAYRFSCGEDGVNLGEHANFCDAACATRDVAESRRDGYATLAPAGALKPNPWGLHDMHGNVMEWCADRHHPEAYLHAAAGTAPAHGETVMRVARGGSYNFPAALAASGRRYRYLEEVSNDYIGFRLLIEAP